MYNPYVDKMKINIDLYLILAEAYFGSSKPKAFIIDIFKIQLMIQWLRQQKNFLDFTNFILNLNQLSIQNLVQMDKYEYLSGKKFDFIEIKEIILKPFNVLAPTLKSINDCGIMIYTILQFVPNINILERKLNNKSIFFQMILFEFKDYYLRNACKIQKIAHDLSKYIQPPYTQAIVNNIGHLTLYMTIKNEKKKNQNNIIRIILFGLEFQKVVYNPKFVISHGRVHQLLKLDQKTFLRKFLLIQKYLNWEYLEKNFSINFQYSLQYLSIRFQYMNYEKSFSFYNLLGNEEGYFVSKSPYHNKSTIFTNMP